MKTFDQVVDDIFVKEGDVYKVVDQPTGRGGITLPTLTSYMQWKTGTQIEAAIPDLQNLTHEDARAVVEWVLERLTEEMRIANVFGPLRFFLLDFAYNSGAERAIRWLQRALFINPSGVMDSTTAQALMRIDNRIVLQALIGGRLQMVRGWAKDPKNHQFEDGLLDRILSFSLINV